MTRDAAKMRRISKFVFIGGAVAVLGASAFTAWQAKDPARAPAAALDRASAVFDLLWARPFRLDEPYTHWYRVERPTVHSGWLLVLDVDPALAAPRQTLEPVLYVGDETAERVNHGAPSGRAVVIVPSPLGADGQPELRLEDALLWFGTPELPERVGSETVRAELAKAQREGLRPLPTARIEAARTAGGALLELQDKTALERLAAELVLRYAPGEEELARSLLVPLSR